MYLGKQAEYEDVESIQNESKRLQKKNTMPVFYRKKAAKETITKIRSIKKHAFFTRKNR